MTTQNHTEGIEVPDDAWTQGGSEKTAYISPWYTATIKHRDLDRQQGKLSKDHVSVAITDLHSYTALADD